MTRTEKVIRVLSTRIVLKTYGTEYLVEGLLGKYLEKVPTDTAPQNFEPIFSGPEFPKIYQTLGLAAQKWHQVSPTRRNFFLKSGCAKTMLKTFKYISL